MRYRATGRLSHRLNLTEHKQKEAAVLSCWTTGRRTVSVPSIALLGCDTYFAPVLCSPWWCCYFALLWKDAPCPILLLLLWWWCTFLSLFACARDRTIMAQTCSLVFPTPTEQYRMADCLPRRPTLPKPRLYVLKDFKYINIYNTFLFFSYFSKVFIWSSTHSVNIWK